MTLVQACFNQLAQRRTAARGRISAATVDRVRATLRSALNTAAREGLLADSPLLGSRSCGQLVRIRRCGPTSGWPRGGAVESGKVHGSRAHDENTLTLALGGIMVPVPTPEPSGGSLG